ncbi:MAG TPA: hypothetical protein DDZ89_19175 [Clostridiales bacterium]|mgnify:CR=1 FL=1|nr:hypothetical protein [Clostridiales bacterium]
MNVPADLLLLSKDIPIAKFINGVVEPILPERLPFFLQRTSNTEAWLLSRAIDSHRPNSRLLKKALRLAKKDDLFTVLSVNAATITDNYWVKPLHDATTYADVRFNFNLFDQLALSGDVDSFNQLPSRTPELTNIGSYEKCWRLIGGKWWMLKAGKPEELFSELLICRIAKLLGFPVAEYEQEGEYIKSRDFTDHGKWDFEPAAGIIGEEINYIQIYELFNQFGAQTGDDYIQMCYLDALVMNMDRHEYNFGLLRNSDTGEVLRMAPFFDHNIALVSRGYSKASSFENDLLINDFTALSRYAKRPLKIPLMTKGELIKQVTEIPWHIPVTDTVPDPLQFTVEYLLKRQEHIAKLNSDVLSFQ